MGDVHKLPDDDSGCSPQIIGPDGSSYNHSDNDGGVGGV